MSKYEAHYKHILDIETKSIGTLYDSLDHTTLDRLVDLMLTIKDSGHKVITAGCGTSGIAAQKIAHTLSVVEIPAFYLSPAVSIHGDMGAIQQGDVVVLITKGGNTKEMLDYIPVCKAKGALTIGVTENPKSKLAESCDIPFIVKVNEEPCPWNLIASGSTLAVQAAWDVIALTAMQYNGFTKEQFYLTHPGGLVGEILRQEQKVN